MLSLPLPLISFLCIFKDVYTSFFNPFWPSLMLLNKLCLLLQSQTLSSSIFKLESQVVLFCVENISSFLITYFFFVPKESPRIFSVLWNVLIGWVYTLWREKKEVTGNNVSCFY